MPTRLQHAYPMKLTDRTLRSNRQRYQIYAEQKGLCALCGLPMGDDFEIDHKKPKVKRGVTAYYNLQATHRRCNRQKGSK
jgi:5-methylcytosine-specific restriction endonuclease McrA